MRRTIVYALGTIGAMGLAGALGGMATVYRGSFREPHFAALVCAVLFLSGVAGAQLHRHGVRRAPLHAALAAGLCAFSFFALPLALRWNDGVDPAAATLFLGPTPLLVAGLAGAGALFLCRGVDRYRAAHGLAHAPRPR